MIIMSKYLKRRTIKNSNECNASFDVLRVSYLNNNEFQRILESTFRVKERQQDNECSNLSWMQLLVASVMSR